MAPQRGRKWALRFRTTCQDGKFYSSYTQLHTESIEKFERICIQIKMQYTCLRVTVGVGVAQQPDSPHHTY